jgi:hypothetical protein
MHTNLGVEWNIAQEKRQDWLHQAEQERLAREAKTEHGSSRRAQSSLRMWLVRRRAVT